MKMKKVMLSLAFAATMVSMSGFAGASQGKKPGGYREALNQGAGQCTDQQYKQYMKLKQERYAHQYDDIAMQNIQIQMDKLPGKQCEMRFTQDTHKAFEQK